MQGVVIHPGSVPIAGTTGPGADFASVLTGAIRDISGLGVAYLSNRLAYEQADDELDLYAQQIRTYQTTEAIRAQQDGISIPSSVNVAGSQVPTWALALGAVLAIGAVVYLAKG